jgi:predicted phage baseplate assembly protein
MIETVPGPDGREYHLSMFPVIREEVWVNEAGHLSPEDQERLAADQPSGIEVSRDQIGNVLEAWFKWLPVEDFSQSSPQDRHYRIDRLTGTIAFGDGRNGRVPPHLGRDNVKINYKIGGGAGGNLGALEIKSLQNSIVFVDGVYNPDPTGGGYNTETLKKALVRGPQVLKHRNRAVTAEDYQWLVREASQDIVRVKCLPNLNREGKKESGCLSVVVVPGEMGGDSFPGLKARVERYLGERSAATAVFNDAIHVMEPAYLKISVLAELAVDEVDAVALTEKEAVEKLNDFLHPLTGNFHGRGWEIGQYPHISEFYTLLKSVNNVNYVENVGISIIKVENGAEEEMNPDFLDQLPYGMVMNGRHRVAVGVR